MENAGKEGYSGGWSPGVVSVGRRSTGMRLGVRTEDSLNRRIGDVVHAVAIRGIDDRQALDVARHAGTVYALGVVVVMGRRRENEKGDGENRGPTLESQPIWSHVGEHSTHWRSCQVPSTLHRFRNAFNVFT